MNGAAATVTEDFPAVRPPLRNDDTTAAAPRAASYHVPNVPQLAQADPRITVMDPSPEMAPMLGWGCYDASIVMMAHTALANRKASLVKPKGRTAQFDAITAATAPDGQHVPKVLNQLIWQYRRAIDAKPYYVQEMLADFAGGKILQPHDPMDYGQCWGPATNTAGAALRDGTWNSQHVSNSYVRQLLDNGFIAMVAFGRYTPIAKLNTITGRWDVTLTKTPGDQHKVIVAGYRDAAYPLEIHDPLRASGPHANMPHAKLVPMGPGLQGAQRPFGEQQASGSNLGDLTFVSPDGTAATSPRGYLEFEGTVTPGSQVFFLEHVDAVSLNCAGIQRVFSGWWGDWTHMAMFSLAGQDYLITYNRPTGQVFFSQIPPGLQGALPVWEGRWGDWTHLLPLTLSGTPYLMTYNQGNGSVMLSSYFAGPNGVKTEWQGTWGHWTHFAPFKLNGEDYLLVYDRDTGTVAFSEWWSNLNGVKEHFRGRWGTWSSLLPMHYYDKTYLVAYDSATGAAQIARFASNLQGTFAIVETQWEKGCVVEPLLHAGPPQFTVHNPVTNRTQVYRIYEGAHHGHLQLVYDRVMPVDGGGTASAINVAFRVGTQSLQLSYRPQTRNVEFRRFTCM